MRNSKLMLVMVSIAAAACRPTADGCEAPGAKCYEPHDAGDDAGRDAGTDGGSGDDGGTRYVGRVAITTLERANGLHLASAVFQAPTSGPADDCAAAVERAGPCCFHLPPGNTPLPQMATAGRVSFSVNGAEVAGLEPMMGGYFGFQWGPPTPPAAGDTVTVSAVGDTVAAFTASAVQPGPLASLSPAWSSSTTLDLDRATALTFTWQPGPAEGKVRLLMAGQGTDAGNPDRGVIECEVSDSAGSLTVAASLFSHFQAGDVCSVCGLSRVARGTASTSNADVTFELVWNAGGTATFR